MKFNTTRWQDMDRRSGYQRQEQEEDIITCECGARVIESTPGTASYKRFGKFYHVGPCALELSMNGSASLTSGSK